MPKVLTRRDPDPDLEAALREWALFERPEAWRRSAKGNLTRLWNGSRVTIFRRGASFRWCVNDPDDETQFSSRGYETQAEAVTGAGYAVGVAYWYVGRAA